MPDLRDASVTAALGLAPHPEGGLYREVWRGVPAASEKVPIFLRQARCRTAMPPASTRAAMRARMRSSAGPSSSTGAQASAS